MIMSAARAHGIEMHLPRGWDVRIFKHDLGEPTLHAANFALPPTDGEFGTRATAHMKPAGVFLALTEYRPDAKLTPGRGLFAAAAPRRLEPADFSPRSLLRPRPGHVGLQRFFTSEGRPFCLYVVLGSQQHARRLAEQVTACLQTLAIAVEPR